MSESGAYEHRQALPRGHVLNDRYELLDVLGVGGFGVTYLGHDAELERQVAIKEYFPNEFVVREGRTVHAKSLGDRDDVEWGLARFLDEARVLARFRHPNLMRVIDYFKGNGTAYIVMDYEDGEPLDKVLDRLGGRLSESQLRKVLLPVVDGLGQVHAAGFLHRDIKPSNVFIRRSDESPVLLDFGAARHALGRKSNSLTAIVSAGYSPPEQYESVGSEGVWTDIYALSALCYRAVTGEVPVEATSRMHRLARGQSDPQPPLAERAGKALSGSLIEAVDRGLRVDERARPASLEEWVSLLGGARSDGTSAASPKPDSPASVGPGLAVAGGQEPVHSVAHGSGRFADRRWWFAGATLATVVLTAGGFLLSRGQDNGDSPGQRPVAGEAEDGEDRPSPPLNGPQSGTTDPSDQGNVVAPELGSPDSLLSSTDPVEEPLTERENELAEPSVDGGADRSDVAPRVPGSPSSERPSVSEEPAVPAVHVLEYATHLDRVEAGSTDVYELTFAGGGEATVLVEGDGDTDLDLYVLDESGNRVCVDDDVTDVMVCSWTPARTGEFQVAIRNLGDVYNEYSLRTSSGSGDFVKTVIARHVDRVEVASTDVYELTFGGGKEATVFVEGDGDTDLDLYVLDESGNRVCVDDDVTDVMVCSWTPARTGEFQVAIRNLGDVYNAYSLSTSNSSGDFVKTVIARHVDRVEAESTDVYELTFVGGREAMVFVEGDGDTDLDLYVLDESGNRVCVDDDVTDVMVCSWTPARTGEFQVAIRNLGDEYNAYSLSTGNSSGDFVKTVIATHVGRVEAESTDVYELTFVGGREAMVFVEGDGDTDLDLYVLDGLEHDQAPPGAPPSPPPPPICVDDGPTDVMICSWTPARTGQFRVEIRNRGDVYNEYILQTDAQMTQAIR